MKRSDVLIKLSLFYSFIFLLSCSGRFVKSQSLEKRETLTHSIELYFPNAACTELSRLLPLDTLRIEDIHIVGYIYALPRETVGEDCLEYYSHYRKDKGVNYRSGKEYYEYDSTLLAMIYEVGKSYDTLFDNTSNDDHYQKFLPNAYFGFIDSYLFTDVGYEWYSMLLINRNSGEKIRLWDIPEFNFSRNLFLTSFHGEISREEMFSLYKVDQKQVVELWTMKLDLDTLPYFKSPYKPVWINDSVFIYQNRYGTGDNFYALALKMGNFK